MLHVAFFLEASFWKVARSHCSSYSLMSYSHSSFTVCHPDIKLPLPLPSPRAGWGAKPWFLVLTLWTGKMLALWNSGLLHALITLARAGSKLLSSLSKKPDFYSEPICPDDNASAGPLLHPPSSFQYWWGRNGMAPEGAPVAAEPKSLSLCLWCCWIHHLQPEQFSV